MNKHMENLDEFMRHKFNSEEPAGRFEFREEYWEQAVALIELDEASRKKHRRWLLFWWVSGLILLAGAWGFWETGSELLRNKNRQESAASVASSDHPVVSSGLLNPHVNQQINNASVSSQQVMKNSNSAVPDTREQGKEKNEASISTVQNTKDAATSTFPINVSHTQDNIRKKNIYELLRKAERAPLGTILPDPAKNASLKQPAAVDENSQSVTAINGTLTTAVKTPETGAVAFVDESTNPILPNPKTGLVASEQKALRLTMFAPLSLPMQEIVYKKALTRSIPTANIVSPKPIKVLKDKRFRMGLEAFASAFIFDQSATRWGGGVGAIAELAFQKHWSATAGLRYRFIPKPASTAVAVQEEYMNLVRYSFGAQYIEQKRDVTGFHVIELPLGLQWHTGRFALSAFGAPGIVLGALGQVTKTSTSSLSFASDYNKSQSDIYFSSDVYRRFSMSVGTGVEWQAFSGLSLCAQFQYYGSLIKPALDGTKEKGFGNINAGIKYRF